MKVIVTDLEGQEAEYKDVDELAFSNRESYGWPLQLRPSNGKTKVVVNAEGYSSLVISD